MKKRFTIELTEKELNAAIILLRDGLNPFSNAEPNTKAVASSALRKMEKVRVSRQEFRIFGHDGGYAEFIGVIAAEACAFFPIKNPPPEVPPEFHDAYGSREDMTIYEVETGFVVEGGEKKVLGQYLFAGSSEPVHRRGGVSVCLIAIDDDLMLLHWLLGMKGQNEVYGRLMMKMVQRIGKKAPVAQTDPSLTPMAQVAEAPEGLDAPAPASLT